MVVKLYYTVLQVKWTRIPSHHCHSLSSIFSELVPSGTSGSLSVSISHEVCVTDRQTDGQTAMITALRPATLRHLTATPSVLKCLLPLCVWFFCSLEFSKRLKRYCCRAPKHTHTHTCAAVKVPESVWMNVTITAFHRRENGSY